MPSRKTQGLDVVLDNLGKGLKSKFMISSQKYEKMGELEVIPFGVPEIDRATVIGGIPRGSIVELFGAESGGKSWATYKLIGSAQRMGLRCAFLDIETSFVPEWVESAGVDTTKLLLGQGFDHGEEAMDALKTIVNSGNIDLVVLDSTAALVPKAELEAEMDQHKVAELGRLMSRAVKQINDGCGKTNCTVVFINQIRNKIGVVFGNPETTPGGRALKFYAHMRLKIRRTGLIKGTDEEGNDIVIGATSELKVEKSKVAPPLSKGEFSIYFYPEMNTPKVKLAELAYKVGVIKRKKNDEGMMEYTIGKGKDLVKTGTFDYIHLAEYLESNELISGMAYQTVESAKIKGIVVPDEIKELSAPDAPSTTEDAPTEEPKS